MDTEFIVIYITAKDVEEANLIARGLLEAKLAACVNIVPGVQSIFWWDNKIDEAQEALLIVKSKGNLLDKITEKVKSLHSYDTPEVIALPVVGGSKDYLNWVNESVS